MVGERNHESKWFPQSVVGKTGFLVGDEKYAVESWEQNYVGQMDYQMSCSKLYTPFPWLQSLYLASLSLRLSLTYTPFANYFEQNNLEDMHSYNLRPHKTTER